MVRALASHQCGRPGSTPGPGVIIMWVEFVVGSRPCSERIFSGYSGFPLSSKTNISKFQFNRQSPPISSALVHGYKIETIIKLFVCLVTP